MCVYIFLFLLGIKYGGVKEWQFCWSKYNNTRVPSERKLLLRVLGTASDPWILQRLVCSIVSFLYLLYYLKVNVSVIIQNQFYKVS